MRTAAAERAVCVETIGATKPPMWLIVATAVLAATCLVLAVAETNLWAHYFIDAGEFVSLFGLAFIMVAAWFLYRQRRLRVSLPLVVPWLLYPVITQGDQIIDNLSINPMRIVTHVLLAALFGAPVAVVVLAARHALSPSAGSRGNASAWTAWFPGLRPLAEGRTREGMALVGATLLVAEMWVANLFLGTLMVVTLIVMVFCLLLYGSTATTDTHRTPPANSERKALVLVCVGVASSLVLYLGYKNRPGAYQGSPSAFMDPAQKGVGYPLDRIALPSAHPPQPSDAANAARDALNAYAQTLEQLLAGYHILDRNYTWDFHNELFLRATPLVPDYRRVGLEGVARARQLRESADRRAAVARAQLASDDPLAALLDEMTAYVAFNFDRAPVLEEMSARFEQTPAGLQHAAHLYEGENKVLGQQLNAVLVKHHGVLDDPRLAPVTRDFAAKAHEIYEAYAHHVVGF
jgi:hypothetical protein